MIELPVPSSQTVFPSGGSKTFGLLKNDIAALFGFDHDVAETERAGRFMNQIIDELNMKQVWIFNLVESPTITTSNGTATYALQSDFWKTYNARKTSDIDYMINTLRTHDFDNLFVSQRNINGFPYVMVIRNSFRDGNVTLFPTPDAVYSFVIRYFKLIAKPSVDTDFLDLPQPYQTVVEYGASSRMAARFHQMDLASYYQALYDKAYADMRNSDEDLGDESLRFQNLEEIMNRSTNFVNPAARPRAYDFF